MRKKSKHKNISILFFISAIFLFSLFILFKQNILLPGKTKFDTMCILPSYIPGNNDIIKHTGYTLKYAESYEQPEWVAYKLTYEMTKGTCKRIDNFRPDPMVKTGSAEPSDYKSSGYDRGHLAPAGDMKWSDKAMSESFYMSNISPQKPGFNRGIWEKLEEQVRQWAKDNREIYVVTGPILSKHLLTIGKNKVAVPSYFYKVILDFKEPEIKGIGFVLPNQSSINPLATYAITIDSVETLTGIDFFPAIPDTLENIIESSLQRNKWGF
ncbi:MAG: DNA/RNA non-specific endonuclease [bacterium]|nr:DNA/RNA non-specific endonuclease [bacterium]